MSETAPVPEFVEVEAYRRTAEPLVGATVAAVEVCDDRLLRLGTSRAEIDAVSQAERIEAVRRTGKVLFIDLSSGHSLAVTFGLRGRLVLDGRIATADGRWRSARVRGDHVRLRAVADGRDLLLQDQLRLATIMVDMDEDRLGPDVLAITKRQFRDALGRSAAVLKSRLMDQRVVAGIGNLIADEIFYQSGVDPRRASNTLDADEFDRLWSAVRRTRRLVLDKGGSHHGDFIQLGARERGRLCPRCGVEVWRKTVGGRTTFFCPEHQR